MHILFLKKCLGFCFRLYDLSEYLPIFKMAAIVNLYRQMVTGVRLQGHADSVSLAETMIKIL